MRCLVRLLSSEIDNEKREREREGKMHFFNQIHHIIMYEAEQRTALRLRS